MPGAIGGSPGDWRLLPPSLIGRLVWGLLLNETPVFVEVLLSKIVFATVARLLLPWARAPENSAELLAKVVWLMSIGALNTVTAPPKLLGA